MLPYQKEKLEKLLEKLFEDDEPITDGVEVLKNPFGPKPSSSCCTYSYACYS